MRIHNGLVRVALGPLALLASAAPALAGGDLLPSSQAVGGYSLADAAGTTAVFNTGTAAHNPSTPALPTLPFDVVTGDTTESPNTHVYLPIYYADNSPPVDPNFPANISNPQVNSSYLLGSAGVSRFLVQVDGQTNYLDSSYITAVNTPTLLDGTPGGNEYISISAFLSPLSPGTHTVGIGGTISGTDHVFLSYAVNVVPEPAWACALPCAIGSLLSRRRRR